MATVVYNDAFFELNGVNLSDHVHSLTVNYSSEALDETAMGDSSRVHKPGLFDYSIEVEAHQDFAVGDWDDTLWGIVGADTSFEFRGVNDDVGASNPRWTGRALVESYSPASGTVGDLLNSTVTLVSGSETIARSVAAT